MDVTTLVAAAAESEHAAHSQAPFLIIGGILAAFAVVVAALGIARPAMGSRVTNPALGIGTLLVAGTMVAIVAVS